MRVVKNFKQGQTGLGQTGVKKRWGKTKRTIEKMEDTHPLNVANLTNLVRLKVFVSWHSISNSKVSIHDKRDVICSCRFGNHFEFMDNWQIDLKKKRARAKNLNRQKFPPLSGGHHLEKKQLMEESNAVNPRLNSCEFFQVKVSRAILCNICISACSILTSTDCCLFIDSLSLG